MPGEPASRRRGGQPGNVNAVRTGFWSTARLTPHAVELLAAAERHGSPSDVVHILMVELARLLEGAVYEPIGLAALARAIIAAQLAEAKLGAVDSRDATAALDTVLGDLLRARGA